MSSKAEAGATLHLRRTLPAPRDEVFAAWTEAARIPEWFGPAGRIAPRAEVDLRVGGRYRIEIQDGELVLSAVGRYLEIEPPERLVFTFGWEPVVHEVADIGETVVTVELRDREGSTEMTLTHEGLPTEEAAQFHDFGWGASFDRLEALAELR
ncbi:MAG: SRPBCC domain-containing protein [Thermoleophilaceae bacterium]